MEDMLREPVKLSDSKLNEIAGGGGECGCGGTSVELELQASVCLGSPPGPVRTPITFPPA